MFVSSEDIVFNELDKNLESIIRTSSILAKLKGKDNKLIYILEQEYKNDPFNIEKICAYCFYLWFLADDRLDLSDTNSVFQVSFNLINVVDDVVEIEPRYWILWILKYRIQSFMNFSEEELISDLKELLQIQRLKNYPSYFLVSDILLSHVYYLKGRYQEAEDILKEVNTYYEGKIKILKEFFQGFIDEYRNLVKRSEEESIMELLNQIEKEYF
ncbi:hypothetical protein [uncultured Tissierella sp.]|jgi:hypothetical protein|uniref:hypothetical protein n=1 Tax=uncultured Tissierella sp. TaxID=448160 RepID=UPI002805C691|nr:hypothetical protein [uncultured Tissierella sp.]MDU5080197.1 hypothetical protein [Bacillota bacterium]